MTRYQQAQRSRRAFTPEITIGFPNNKRSLTNAAEVAIRGGLLKLGDIAGAEFALPELAIGLAAGLKPFAASLSAYTLWELGTTMFRRVEGNHYVQLEPEQEYEFGFERTPLQEPYPEGTITRFRLRLRPYSEHEEMPPNPPERPADYDWLTDDEIPG